MALRISDSGRLKVYICICQAITDHAIREEIKTGEGTVKAIAKKMNIGNGCAKCIGEIKDLLNQTLLESDINKRVIR